MLRVLFSSCIALLLATAAEGRLLAIGDLHGDYNKAVEVLTVMGVIDSDKNWIGGTDTVVQLGDVTDRGPYSREIIDLFEEVKASAKLSGGQVVTLLGNHELMNLMGDLRYVNPQEYKTGDRINEFKPHGKYWNILKDYPVVFLRGSTIFVHAGFPAAFARLGVNKINEMVHDAISISNWHSPVLGGDGPLWTREEFDCRRVSAAIAAINEVGEHVRRIVVGHTIQRNGRITEYCDGQLYAIDVAMSTAITHRDYLAYLEITPEGAVPHYRPVAEDHGL
eukprot:TRINITY_DN3744_c0_g1_i2.p1 TRINITY_DN3744_c0_g1~~TRINITY_DN3744_c0_g1_i2.p1  ORF type:complete len:315 (+),score=46.66 TRINITY_DN3744_c0_g1_i2:109-945(+)